MQIVEHPGGVGILAAVEVGERHWTAVGHPVTRFRWRSRIRLPRALSNPRLKRPIYCVGSAPFVLGRAASANPAPTNQRASRALVNYCHRRRPLLRSSPAPLKRPPSRPPHNAHLRLSLGFFIARLRRSLSFFPSAREMHVGPYICTHAHTPF